MIFDNVEYKKGQVLLVHFEPECKFFHSAPDLWKYLRAMSPAMVLMVRDVGCCCCCWWCTSLDAGCMPSCWRLAMVAVLRRHTFQPLAAEAREHPHVSLHVRLPATCLKND
jgi:hypothetical protein